MSIYTIPLIIFGAGFLFFIILVSRSLWKQTRKNIEDYKKGRDKLTFRDRVNNVTEYLPDGFPLGNIIGGFIVILVGTALLPTVAQLVGTAQADGNVTGASDTLVGLCVIFFAIGICLAAVAMSYQGLKSSGLVD